MRFSITLRANINAFGRRLPLNYQYELSAVVYRILASANETFALWLHDNGFRLENAKTFKLFTFSRLKPQKYRILPKLTQMELQSELVEWQISFLPGNSTQRFIEGLFQNRVFEVGNKQSVVQFQVENISMMPSPECTAKMQFETLSPITVSQRLEDGRDHYPQDVEEFANSSWVKERLLQNLLDKYESFYGNPFNGERYFDLMVLSEPKSSLVTIKANTPQETKVRGFMCKFAMHCPVELMKIAYESGLGEDNSQGFGCLGKID